MHVFPFSMCRRQKTMQVDATVFTCISMLSRAMGPNIQPDIKELLEPMLAVGLRLDRIVSPLPGLDF